MAPFRIETAPLTGLGSQVLPAQSIRSAPCMQRSSISGLQCRKVERARGISLHGQPGQVLPHIYSVLMMAMSDSRGGNLKTLMLPVPPCSRKRTGKTARGLKNPKRPTPVTRRSHAVPPSAGSSLRRADPLLSTQKDVNSILSVASSTGAIVPAAESHPSPTSPPKTPRYRTWLEKRPFSPKSYLSGSNRAVGPNHLAESEDVRRVKDSPRTLHPHRPVGRTRRIEAVHELCDERLRLRRRRVQGWRRL